MAADDQPTSASGAPGRLAELAVAIVGTGLIGGSIGMALHGHVRRRLAVVLPTSPADADAPDPVVAGAVDEVVGPERLGEVGLVLLAVPVGAVPAVLGQLAPHLAAGSVVTDVGGAKRSVVAAMASQLPPGVAGVGGHPMFGREAPGLANATAGLARGASWAVVPCPGSDERAVALVVELVRAVGAVPVHCTPGDHDIEVARTSHATYLVGAALASAVAGLKGRPGGVEGPLLAGGGLRDATRLARGDEATWADVLLANADEVVAATGEVAAALAQLARVVGEGDRDALVAHLAAARSAAQRLAE